MQQRAQVGKTIFLVTATVLAITALVVVGCTAGTSLQSSTGTTINTATTSVPVSITDAPGDAVLATTLTLNSVVLKDASGGTASVLTSPLTFEAAHLDAVQEPLFTPAVPEDTYTSVTLTYSTAVVAYVDSTTKQVTVANATLANTSQTITFSTPITIDNTRTALLIDYLVANSVTISGSTVIVTPTFNISAAHVRSQPTNGANGLECGVKGEITALGTNQFTLVNAAGTSFTINVNSNTHYQGNDLTDFSQLIVGMFVEVDVALQTDGSMLAERVEEEEAPKVALAMLVGPVTSITGSPATSFTQVVRQQVGTSTTSPVQTETISIASSTKFILPGRYQNIALQGIPFTPVFSASTIFAGQTVEAATSGVTNNTATALAVRLAPQTIAGTVASGLTGACTMCWTQYTITMPSDSWVATLTGKTSITVLVPPSGFQDLASTTLSVGDSTRFNGYLFNNNGALTMIAVVQGPGPGNPINQK